eukprot:TRINITY_DN4665_c0_g2_i1.p1 TRINITY_DN4665_c0_g2~~TRINITY_DN4665_c0_g2_i1.p1  ORF type:complete len:230 (-),score=35.23 TRINITY_DN4665_c0_g2_i1:622-1224(-)
MMILLILLFTSALAIPDNLKWPAQVPNVSQWYPKPTVPVDRSKWMEEHWDTISHLTLKDITVPGTHDSGSWSVTDQLLGVPTWLDEIVKIADFLHLPVGTIIDWWAQSQTQNFFDQFTGGIRYVDVRVIYDTTNRYWRTHHGIDLTAKRLSHSIPQVWFWVRILKYCWVTPKSSFNRIRRKSYCWNYLMNLVSTLRLNRN